MVIKIYEAYINFATIPWIGFPLAIFIWSFLNSSAYYKENLTFLNQIRDNLDRQAFRKIIVPLFSFINSDLTQDIIKNEEIMEIDDKEKLIIKVDDEKKEILKNRDFSYLDDALDFQVAIQELLESKNNTIVFKQLVKACHRSLVGITISSAVNIIIGILLIFFIKVMPYGIADKVMILLWIIAFLISIGWGLIYYIKNMRIQKLSNE